jgi:hypothetical protein
MDGVFGTHTVAVEPKSPLRAPRPGRSRHVKFPAPERT